MPAAVLAARVSTLPQYAHLAGVAGVAWVLPFVAIVTFWVSGVCASPLGVASRLP